MVMDQEKNYLFNRRTPGKYWLFYLSVFSPLLLLLPLAHAEIGGEQIPKSLSLPKTYPQSWVVAHDTSYWSSLIGKFIILDVGATTHQYKGVLQGAHNAAFAQSKRHNELYVAESLYSRGTYGERTDLLVVYEKENLSPIAEIVLPGNKRAVMVSDKGLMRLTRNEQFALVFNFTPAASVTVVDLEKRQVVNEVAIPGCTLIYPSGQSGFSTLCGNGTLASFTLDKQGKTKSETFSDHFNDIDNNVLYMSPTTIKGIAYFPTFLGDVQPIDMNKAAPKILPTWPLISAQQRDDGWRTSSGPSVASDDAGQLFVRVHRVRSDGSHLPGSAEVWVYNVKTKKRINRFLMKKEGGPIEVTPGKQPYLVTLSADGVDVYDANNGEFIRTIGDFKGTLGRLYASQ